MPVFYYKAVNTKGEVVEGEMTAQDQAAVIVRLQGQGFTPIRADELTSGQAKRTKGQKRTGKNRIHQEEVGAFTEQLATLLNAGLPLDRALETLIDLAAREEVATILSNIRDEVRGGESLATAMDGQKGVFTRFYINMIRAGEAGSAMNQVLLRLSQFMKSSRELRETVKSALIYPTILIGVAGMSVVILLAFVVPQFTAMFEDAGQALPFATQVVIALGDGVRDYWWAIAGVIIGIVSFFKNQFANPTTRRFWDRKMLKIGLVGDLITKFEVARFARTLGTLLENGVPLLTAMAIIKETIGNIVLVEAVAKVTGEVKEGKGLSEPLLATGVFPKMAVQMVRIGEETGAIDEMLMKVADVYDDEVKRSVQRMLALLEPILILGLGLVISGIIFSILLAILSVNELAM